MKAAYTLWTWGLNNENDFEVSIRDAKETGYDYFENFDGLADMYFDRNDEFQATLKKYDIKFINIYDYISDTKLDHTDRAKKLLTFLKRNDAHYMNIQAPGRSNGAPSKQDLDEFCKILNDVGKLAREYNIWLCMHPHFETTVEQEQEIDYIAANMNPEYAGFCFDTAHLTVGGMDSVKMFEKHAELIKYVHLKDAKKVTDVEAERNKWKNWSPDFRVFYELGEADIDFPGVIDVLKKAGYDGYLCVELDHTRYGNRESAVMSRKYIREKLGL